MSLNWVMRTDFGINSTPFVLLPNEVILYTLPQRAQVELSPVGQEKPETLSIRRAQVFLTSQRIVILNRTDTQTETSKDLDLSFIDNFTLLYQDIRSYKLDMPWFGSNKFKFLFNISNPDGGLNYLYPWSMTVHFIEGGAIEFSKSFSQVLTRFNNDQIDELPQYTPN
ncbi:hypothetical protein WICPIJ_004256 [Wickerhamomyces pijperi]|uniref:Uncharacterized protein n=1 Tax=Wickerhamomyces pijperi TaxID=599730 RepID=A0A9P8Q836_WICPI|nr:hypothetical protein WICPIJ_004256 [Wickerhamomyces pijperi]